MAGRFAPGRIRSEGLEPGVQQAEFVALRVGQDVPALGAGLADVGLGDASWLLLADPEGNEFCVLADRRP